ncbi:MAG: prepilin peptidase [Chloroflexota bacterium]
MAAAVRFGPDWALPAYLVFFAALVVLSVVDVRSKVIPSRVVNPAIALCLGLLALAAVAGQHWGRLTTALLGAGLAGGVLLAIHLIAPGGMGFGDVRLGVLVGLVLGWLSLGTVAVGVFLAFLLAAAFGVGLRRLRGPSSDRHVPFGPYLAAGAVVAVLLGEQIIGWYKGLAG